MQYARFLSSAPFLVIAYLLNFIVKRLEGRITEAGQLVVDRRYILCYLQNIVQDIYKGLCALL